MVWRSPQPHLANKMVFLHEYHPWRGGHNPRFDENSERILKLKESNEAAVIYYVVQLERMLLPDIAVAVVPGHQPGSKPSGVVLVAQALARTQRIDATACLVRHTPVAKLSRGGNRSLDTHRNSIRVDRPEIVRDRDVVLLDDVLTTGNSLVACAELLRGAGARSVQAIALARTV